MKLVNKNAKANLILWRFVCCAMIVFLYSCGSGGGGDGDDDGDAAAAAGPGTLSFSLSFEEPDGNFTKAFNAARSPSGNICVDYGIKTIIAKVFDSSNTEVAANHWPCSDHKGTITNVPTGSGISLEVFGTVEGDEGVRKDWHGKKGNLSVFPDENTDAGKVDMFYIGNDVTPPEVDSTDPSENATDFPINTAITCTFSEDMVHASVNEDTFTLNFGSEPPLTGAVTYDIMDLIATFEPDGDLEYCITYTATISKKVEDLAGINMAEDFSWSFTTLPDKDDPKYKWYKDSDEDKYSDGTEKLSCDKPGDDYYLERDLLSTSGDCNDNDASINPKAEEKCDGVDNDCDSDTADGSAETWYGAACDGPDSDQCEEGTYSCSDGEQLCSDNSDDTIEVCDGQDNDCDGGVDEDLNRVTSCGVGACAGNKGTETCTDGQWGDDTCNPLSGATTEICDGLDNDCNGEADDNLTRDTSCGVGACADNAGTETCTDGQWGNDTCNPLSGATPEICDGQDNDCDGSVDEDLTRDTSCGVGACAGNTGTETCTDGQWGNDTCNPLSGATPEICDDQDNDCDGSVDEDLTRDTSCGVGECAGNTGIETCTNGEWGDDTCDPFVGATTEICDDQDNDCDGSVDEDLTRDTSCGVGECEGNTGIETCTSGEWGDDTCDPFDGATSEIVCDGIDQDCDGSDLCIIELFDFEELAPTYVFDNGGRPGALTSLTSKKSVIAIDIYRETASVFDTVDHTSLLPDGPIPGYGSVSLDPWADLSETAFIVNFSMPVSSVSVDMGDYNTNPGDGDQDDDVLKLEAYSLPDALGELLDSDQIDLPDTPSEIRTWSSETLYVAPASGCIESIRMIGGGSTANNSVYYDNIVVEAPCEPAP